MAQPPPRRVYRSKTDRMLSGVSGGLAEYFDIDPVLIRLLWVLAAIFSGGLAIIAYLALWIIVPLEGSTGGPREVARRNVEEIRAEAERLAAGVRQSVRGEPIAAEQAQRPVASDPSSGAADRSELDAEAQPALTSADVYPREESPGLHRRHRSSWAGIILILIGVLFLASNLGLFWWFNWRTAWPIVLIAMGLLLLWNRRGR